MADEAAVTVVMRMRDEASAEIKKFGSTTQQTGTQVVASGSAMSTSMREVGQSVQAAQVQALQFNVAMSAMGSALTAVGSLISRVDDPMAKLAANFITTAGAMLSTVSAITIMIPQIRQLITWLRSLAIAQALVRALSGPAGWVTLGVGLAAAGAATAGIMAMTGGFGGGGGGTTVNINSQAFTGNESEARKFAGSIQRIQRENSRIGR